MNKELVNPALALIGETAVDGTCGLKLQRTIGGSAISGSMLPRHQDDDSESAKKTALVLVHGWASGSWVWEPVVDVLSATYELYFLDLPGYGANVNVQAEDPEAFVELFESLLSELPPRFALMGWSLGGALASMLAVRYADRVSALVTVATSPQFVESAQWRFGMSEPLFDQFNAALRSDPAKLIKRFALLQAKSGSAEKACARFLVNGDRVVAPGTLAAGLDWLKSISLCESWRVLNVPVLHIYGENDGLLAANIAEEVERQFKPHRVSVLREAAHLPFFDSPDELEKTITEFFFEVQRNLRANSAIDRSAVIQAFSRAVPDYDRLAAFQWRVANDLVKSLSEAPVADSVVDLGSGTGFLSRVYPPNRARTFYQLDLCQQMLTFAKRHMTREQPLSSFVQGDCNALPFADASIDLFLSSMAIQWSESLDALFADAYRSLKPGGRFVFSTLLPDSLAEIQQAWSVVDDQQHVHTFIPKVSVERSAVRAGFSISRWQDQSYIERFENSRDLLASVKGIGAGNHRQDRRPGLLGKQKYKAFINALRDVSVQANGFSLTYRVLLAEVAKPS